MLDGRVAGDQVGRRLVDAIRHLLERGRELVAVRLVPQDRGREVEDEHDLGLVRRRGAGGRAQGPAGQQGPDVDRDENAR